MWQHHPSSTSTYRLPNGEVEIWAHSGRGNEGGVHRDTHPHLVRVHHSRTFALVLRATLFTRTVHSSYPLISAECFDGACPQTIRNSMARSAHHPENHLHRHLDRIYLYVAPDHIRAGGAAAAQSRTLHVLPRACAVLLGDGWDARGWPCHRVLPAQLWALQPLTQSLRQTQQLSHFIVTDIT